MIKNNRHVVFQLAVLAAAVLGCSLSSAQVRTGKKSGFRFPSAVPAPASNKGTPQRVKLGEMLFLTRVCRAPIGSVVRPVTTRLWDGRTASQLQSAMA